MTSVTMSLGSEDPTDFPIDIARLDTDIIQYKEVVQFQPVGTADPWPVDSEACFTPGKMTLILAVMGLILYVGDIGSDINLAVKYRRDGETTFFLLTLLFITVPAVCLSLYSLSVYYHDSKEDGSVSKKKLFVRAFLIFLLSAPLERSLSTLWYAWKSYRSKKANPGAKATKDANKWVDSEVYLKTLQLYGGFAEGGCQLLLQTYILLQLKDWDWGEDWGRLWSISTSLVALSLAIVGYDTVVFQSRNRYCVTDDVSTRKMILNIVRSSGVQFLWRLCMLTARVMAITLLVVYSWQLGIGLLAVHYVPMFVWANYQRTHIAVHSRESGMSELGFRALASYVLLFDFLNLLEGRTRLRVSVYYTVMVMENLAALMVWYFTTASHPLTPWDIAQLIMVIIPSILGIVFLVVHYKVCHSKEIPWWVPCSQLPFIAPRDTSAVQEPAAIAP